MRSEGAWGRITEGLVGHCEDGTVSLECDGKPLRILDSRELDVIKLNLHWGHPPAVSRRNLSGPFPSSLPIQA